MFYKQHFLAVTKLPPFAPFAERMRSQVKTASLEVELEVDKHEGALKKTPLALFSFLNRKKGGFGTREELPCHWRKRSPVLMFAVTTTIQTV